MMRRRYTFFSEIHLKMIAQSITRRSVVNSVKKRSFTIFEASLQFFSQRIAEFIKFVYLFLPYLRHVTFGYF